MTFDAFLRDTPHPMVRWRPHAEHWCLLEVVCHLRDEEVDDFRARTRSVLEDPESPLPPTDPPAWVTERAYMEQSFEAALDDFLAERDASIAWLNALDAPAWDNAFQHPKVGPLTARMFLTNWLAHDLLHLRQIVRIKFQYLHDTSGVRTDYAGTW